MAQQWFYTKDGKNKIGPVSAADLQALAKTGQLLPTDMVCKEGMAQWTTASTIKGLFTRLESAANPPSGDAEAEAAERVQIKSRPVPLPAAEQALALVPILSRLALGLTVFLSLLAALFALLNIGGGVLGPIVGVLAIMLGSFAVLLGLVAVGIGLSARKGRPFMETAAIAVFIGVAALLFSIGSTLLARSIKEYRDIAAKADEVDQERARAENARREAKQFKADAEKARDDALDQPQQILKRAKDASNQNDQKLEQINTLQSALNKKRGEDETAIKTERASLDKKREEDEKAIKSQHANLDKKREVDETSFKNKEGNRSSV